MTTATAAPPRARTRDLLLRWADHPSAWLTLNPGVRHFEDPMTPGVVAYAERGGWWFQLGPPHGEDPPALLDAFLAEAGRARKRVCALQLREGDLAPYEERGFSANQLGTSYGLDLTRFSLRGPRFARLRNKLRRAERAGVEVVELGVEVPRTALAWRRLEDLSAGWLKTKGGRPLRFLVGDLGAPEETDRRVFVARRGERWLGFVTYVPAPGSAPGTLHDLSRRLPEAPPGTMERINSCAIERFQGEGHLVLHFGLTPFAGLRPDLDARPTRSPIAGWLTRQLARHGRALYPAASQAAYKRKWGPDLVVPEYLALQGGYRPSSTYRLLQLTGIL